MTAPAFSLEMQHGRPPRLDPLAGPAPVAHPLRWYQQEAIDAAVQWHATHEGHCLLVIPTGGGKSLVIATLAKDALAHGARVLMIAHRKELIDQNVRAARTCVLTSQIGIVSSQLGRKDQDRPLTVGSIQTLARNPYNYGPFDLILCDEAHLLPRSDETQYRKFLDAQHVSNPNVRIIGVTATPYRLDSGRLDQGEKRVFTEIAYECDLDRLIREGYLSPLISKATLAQYDTTGVAMHGGEFAPGALEQRVNTPEATRNVVEELLACAGERRKWLVFASGVAHAERLAEALTAAGVPAGVAHGGLSAGARSDVLARFKAGELRALTNCDLLTTGFDEPAIDLIALCRPTQSAGLYVQMVGRGLRIHPNKSNTLILDFAGCVLTHGPIDAIVVRDRTKRASNEAPPAKACPTCRELVATSVRLCPSCDFAFPPPAAPLVSTRANLAPVLTSESAPPLWHTVTSVGYSLHTKLSDPNKPPTLRVDYFHHLRRVAQEWVCLEHPGFARSKAEQWWRHRVTTAMDPEGALAPRTVIAALVYAEHLRVPTSIATKRDGKFERVVDYTWDSAAPTGTLLPQACWSCGAWSEVAKTCLKFNEVPPDEVQPVGCDAWQDDDLEAPF